MQHAVKTIDAAEGRVGGYLVIWGDSAKRDLQGEYFTPDTDLGLDWYPKRPVLYHHGLDGKVKSAVIGAIDTLKADETGLWAEAQLDLRQRYVQVVKRLVEKGILAWSSGSLPHLAEVAGDGRILRWPIVEGSLTPAPAEPRQTDVHTLKSAYHALGLDTARLNIAGASPPHPLQGTQPPGPPAFDPYQGGNRPESTLHNTNQQGETNPMQDENTNTAYKRLPVAAERDALKRIEVGSPYDSLDAVDMLHGYMLMRAAKGFQGASERYASALSYKLNREGVEAAKSVTGDLNATIVTGFGDDWVPELWSQQIWQKARMENVILPLFRAIEMPSNPFDLPVEGTDPDVFLVPETKDEAQLALNGSGAVIPDSKIGSGKVQLNAQKLALRVGFSAELVEDAIVPVLSIYREQAMRAIANSIDYVLLNGDTNDNALADKNVNGAGSLNATDRFRAFDGLRKVALYNQAVDNSGNLPTLAKLREARFSLAAKYAARPSDLAWIVDGTTYARLLGMSEFLTMDKAGPLATAQTGQIGYVDGVPVVVSAEMPDTSATGKVTGSGDDFGTAVCVYRPGWFVGYRRRIAVSVDYVPYYDSYQMTATVRLAFAPFNTGVASTLYDVGDTSV